jgi:F420-0:gamma-glutamyl ligase
MEFIPIKTRPLLPPQDNLFEIMDEYLPDLNEGDILFITSKVVAIHQGLCIKNDSKVSKKELIEKEADSFLKTDIVP